jgi:DNA-binding LacI/PurR family transcriptional regulator
VLNQREGVGKKTTEKILKTMEKLNFKPRWQAGKARSIGFVLFPHKDCLAFPYNANLLSAASEMLFANGYHVQLIPQTQTHESFEQLQHMINMQQVDGIMVMAFHQSYDLAKLVDMTNIPHVILGGDDDISPNHQITSRSVEGGVKAGNYLWQMGHRNIAVVTPSNHNAVHRKRMEGVCKAYEDHGVSPESVYHLVVPDVQFPVSESAAVELMNRTHPPTAIVCTEGVLTIGLLRGVRRLGLKIPDDVSLIGFENAQELQYVDPPITVLNSLARNMGEAAAQSLLDQIHGRTPKAQLQHDMVMIIRESVARLEPVSP